MAVRMEAYSWGGEKVPFPGQIDLTPIVRFGSLAVVPRVQRSGAEGHNDSFECPLLNLECFHSCSLMARREHSTGRDIQWIDVQF